MLLLLLNEWLYVCNPSVGGETKDHLMHSKKRKSVYVLRKFMFLSQKWKRFINDMYVVETCSALNVLKRFI